MVEQKYHDYLKKLKLEKIIILLSQISITILFLGLWELLSYFHVINSFIFSSPSMIIKTIINLLLQGRLMTHILITLKEVFMAFSLGIMISLGIAIMMYEVPLLAKIIEPFLTIINSLPKVALGPIIIIWFGANELSIIVMALLINLIVSVLTIYNGLKEVDANQILLLKSLGASRYDILTNLVLKSARNAIISSLKLNISMTLIGVIMGEFLVSKSGIGYLIIYGTQIFNLNIVMSGIILLCFISIILYQLILLIEKKQIKK